MCVRKIYTYVGIYGNFDSNGISTLVWIWCKSVCKTPSVEVSIVFGDQIPVIPSE